MTGKSLFPGSCVTIISISRQGSLFNVITELKKRVTYKIYLGMAFAPDLP